MPCKYNLWSKFWHKSDPWNNVSTSVEVELNQTSEISKLEINLKSGLSLYIKIAFPDRGFSLQFWVCHLHDGITMLFSCDQAAIWLFQSVCPSVCLSVRHTFLAATKQLYEWFSPSVCPSVRPSVRPSVTPFWLCSHHPVIMKFSGVITSDKSDVHAKGQGQRSKVKVTEVTTQLNRFRTVTPV